MGNKVKDCQSEQGIQTRWQGSKPQKLGAMLAFEMDRIFSITVPEVSAG